MIKCWYCNEELTTGNNPEHLGICDKCYNNMFKAGNDLIGKMTTKIADLETKLAEKESEIKVGEFWHSAYQGKQLDYDKVYAELRQSYDEVEELKQQLAEKNKEITKLKSDNHALMSDNAYQEADIFEFNSRIEQLQQQLAEKEQTITNLIEDSSASKELYKKQLAEKEKEILNLKNIINGIDTLKQYDKDAKQIILINPDNIYADGHKLVIKQADENKISFAITELEKVKETTEIVLDNALKNSSLNQSYYDRLLDEIDNQIKQLKDMPNEK